MLRTSQALMQPDTLIFSSVSVDEVMVDCSDMGESQNSSSSSSAPFDRSSLFSSVDEMSSSTTRTGVQDANCSSDGNDKPKQKLFSNRNTPCMSSLGIHMCDCKEGSLDCNLGTYTMASPLGRMNTKISDTTPGMMIPKCNIKESEDENFWWSTGENLAAFPSLEAEASGSNAGNRHKTMVLGCESVAKSSLAAWAALVSDGPRRFSVPTTDAADGVSPVKFSRALSVTRQRLPTLASHLELTGNAVLDCKIHHDHGENMDGHSSIASGATQVASTNSSSTLKRGFTGLTLNPGTLSISDPAPYGTLHGLVHCNYKNGLSNYTFLLDDYEEVLTAKIWMKDLARRKEQGSCRYSFYSLRGETKQRGKSGWKHWTRKDKVGATLLGKMKISSTLCLDEKRRGTLKSECILFSARPNDLAMEATTRPSACKDSANSVCTTSSASPTSAYSNFSQVSSSSLSSSSQSSSPWKLTEVDIFQRSKQLNPKCSGLSITSNSTAPTKNLFSTLGSMTINGSTHAEEPLPGSSSSCTNQRLSELAAVIINMPWETQRKVLVNGQHQHASITVILPSGNHGRPLCDLNGPSPLISRWKEGGKCDCKGWDLGCGLMVLHNSTNYERKGHHSSQGGECESDKRPLKLYKQDADQDAAFVSLTPQANGLLGLDFRAPLSPLQAFATAVAILHGRDSNGDLDIHGRTGQALPDHTAECEKDCDGSCVEASCMKKMVNNLINSSQQQQPQYDTIGLPPLVKTRGNRSVFNLASELALSFERV